MVYNLQKYSIQKNRFKRKISKFYTLNWSTDVWLFIKMMYNFQKFSFNNGNTIQILDSNSKKQKSSISLKYLSLIKAWFSKFQNDIQSSEIFESIQILDPSSKKQKSSIFLKYLSYFYLLIEAWLSKFQNGVQSSKF